MSSPENSPTPLDPEMQKLAEQARQHADAVMEKIPLLGAVSWLLMQQGATRHTLLSELEWRVMPALVLGQFNLYMRGKAPLAFVSWARLSQEAAQRYQQAPHHLTPQDWQSGDQLWIVDFIVPFGGAKELWDKLTQEQFKDQRVHRLGLTKEL